MITMVKSRLEVLWWWGQYTQDHFHIWQQYQQWFLLIPSKPNDQLCCPGATALHEDHRHEFSEFSHFSMCTFTHLAKLVQIRILFTVFENYLKKSHFTALRAKWATFITKIVGFCPCCFAFYNVVKWDIFGGFVNNVLGVNGRKDLEFNE